MRSVSIRISTLLLLLLMAACKPPESIREPQPQANPDFAVSHYSAHVEQCALYARRISGVELYGSADSWWGQAKSKYRRGHQPAPGAILVLKSVSHMPGGHVAVVKNIVGPRDIDVTHTNWGETRSRRHMVYDSMRVEDISPKNDWSQVVFWNEEKGVMGFPYPAYGFIYP